MTGDRRYAPCHTSPVTHDLVSVRSCQLFCHPVCILVLQRKKAGPNLSQGKRSRPPVSGKDKKGVKQRMPVGLSPEGKVPKVKLKVKLQLAFKRLLDLAAAALLLLLLSPLMAALALLVRIKLGRPVLFRQVRPGLHGRPFCIYKFRTMTGERDGGGGCCPTRSALPQRGDGCAVSAWCQCSVKMSP